MFLTDHLASPRLGQTRGIHRSNNVAVAFGSAYRIAIMQLGRGCGDGRILFWHRLPELIGRRSWLGAGLGVGLAVWRSRRRCGPPGTLKA
jgi:hypothetical protein